MSTKKFKVLIFIGLGTTEPRVINELKAKLLYLLYFLSVHGLGHNLIGLWCIYLQYL
jgi:hypothetical protein